MARPREVSVREGSAGRPGRGGGPRRAAAAAAERAAILAWLASPENPAVRYLTARDLARPRPSAATLRRLRAEIWAWPPLQRLLARQRPDGSFGQPQKTPDARGTFWALILLERCGLRCGDAPIDRAIGYLEARHAEAGAVSYTSGVSYVLPCYLGVATTALIKLGALNTALVQGGLAWLVAHQRFDHREHRAGGDEPWPYRAPVTYGCWERVSCYHGVAGAFRALAAVPPARRTAAMRARLGEALAYLRAHKLYQRSRDDKPLFRHLLEPFLIGDYRASLLDMLDGIADASPRLGAEPWIRGALEAMRGLTVDGKVVLRKNYGRALSSAISLEPEDQPSRFLTHQWLTIRARLAAG